MATQGTAMFNYIEKVWDLMDSKAEDVEVDGIPRRVYSGFISRDAATVIPMSYYSPVFRLMKTMGCVVRLARGGGVGNQTQIILVTRPTRAEFDAARALIHPGIESGGTLQATRRMLKEQLRQVDQLLKLQGNGE